MKRTTIVSGFLLFCLLCPAVNAAPAGKSPDETATPPSRDPEASTEGFQFQELEDPVPRLKPTRPRGAADEARLDALAWFGTGRMLQDRGDLTGAFRSYRRAIDADPTALAVYKVAIPLAIELRQVDIAARWATKAVELDPADQQMLLHAANLLINRDDLPGAIRLLEQASKSPNLDKTSPQYVQMMRDLAVLYTAAERKEDAAASFEILFDALMHPEKFKLSPRDRTQLQSNPATSFERMGQVFLEAKKTDLALAAFQKAAESAKGPAAGNVSFNLAQVYLQSGQGEKALTELQKYIDSQRQSKGRAAYDLLAEILAKLDRSADLIPRLEAAAGKDPHNSTLQYFLAEKFADANRLDEAEALYKKTLDSAAELPGFVGLAGVYRRQGRPADVLDALARGYSEAGDLKGMTAEIKAVVSDEKLLTGILEAGAKRLDQQPPMLTFAPGYVLANIAAEAKKTDLAERVYRYLLSVRKERANLVYEELGSHLVEVKKYAEAAKVYREAADDDSVSDARPNFLFMLTYALELSGETKKALEAIAAAQQIIPNNPLLMSQEAWVYYHSHQYDEAIRRFEKLIAEFPQPQVRQIVRRAQYSLSNIHVLQGDVRKGIEILEAIYKESPNDISVNNDLGYLYADHGMHLEQAESMIRKALDAEPENAAYLDSMGWVLFKRGKAEDALPYIEKSIKISTGTGDETLYEHLGDVYDKLQQSAKSTEAWQKSLELARQGAYPDQKLIDRVTEKLKNRKQDPGKLKPSRTGSP